jgi:regulator of protease activity HflC (stomatin/prohibitin superfamily)
VNINLDKNTVIVPQSFVGLLYENGAFARALEPGAKMKLRRGLFDDVIRAVILIDMRERSLTLKGQEILTADKVAIRVSILVYFRITDAAAAAHNVASYEERIYEDVQLAARRFLSSRSLDAILSDRNDISDAVRDDVKGTAARYGVEILRADVKDLVFPGNLREIMNQVLETERKAEASLLKAKKEAEAQKIVADAALEAVRAKLAAELDEAKAIEAHPALLELRKLEALGLMAKAGGRFVVGLGDGKLSLSSD